MVHPTLRFAAWFTEHTNRPVERLSPAQARAQLRNLVRFTGRLLMGPRVSGVSVVDRRIAGVGARVYRPSQQPVATVVYFHGGGWVVGDLDTHDGVCRSLAQATGAVVIATDYRLAPEHAFPAAYDDARAVTQAVITQSAALGLPTGPVAVAGDSAGGNLAAAVALHAREHGWPLRAQLLIYPVLDAAAESASYQRFASGYFLTRESMRYYIGSYLPQPADRARPEASPLRAASLSGVAPALVITAEADVLRDEALAYVAALRRDGVAVQHIDAAGMLHGFFNLQSLHTPRAVLQQAAQWLSESLA